MFRRDSAPAETSEARVSDEDTRAAEKKAAHEAECFKPSSFASRAAATTRTATPRIVSLGRTEFTQRNVRTGQVESVPAELFCDYDRPMNRWVEIDGVAGRHPLNAVEGKEDTVTQLGRVSTRRGPSQLTEPALPESPARPI